MSSFTNNITATYNQASSANSQSALQLTPDDITWNYDIFNEIMVHNQQSKNWTVKMIQIIKLTKAMAILKKSRRHGQLGQQYQLHHHRPRGQSYHNWCSQSHQYS